MKRPREILIKPVLNGFIVAVGCQTLVFGNIAELAGELINYYNNPEKVENEYTSKSVNRTLVPELTGMPDPESRRPQAECEQPDCATPTRRTIVEGPR